MGHKKLPDRIPNVVRIELPAMTGS